MIENSVFTASPTPISIRMLLAKHDNIHPAFSIGGVISIRMLLAKHD